MARDPYKYFRIEARDLTDQLGQSMLELERTGSGGEVVPRLLRLAHTLKGAARVVRLPEIADQAHSIEDLLGPFRDQTSMVPREHIESLLKLLDGIAGRVAALAPAEQMAAAGSPSPANQEPAPAPEDSFRAARSDVSEIDDLIDDVAEANTQLRSLGELAASAAQAKRITEQIVEQLSMRSQPGESTVASLATRTSIETLRSLVAGLQGGLVATHERVERELHQVRDAAEQLRLVPANALFAGFERAARDSAQLLAKEIAFSHRGGDVRLDAQVIRFVQDAGIQIVRNAVAHGIEAPAERSAAGKPSRGRVDVSVLRRGRKVVLRFEDDGRGIDAAALRAAAASKGRTSDRMGLGELLLQGGVSTSATLSVVAGRGIGMDIVREAVSKLGADFAVGTETGKGSWIELAVPLSVSSVEALTVETADMRATIPLFAVKHALRLEASDVHRTARGETIIHDGQSIPLVPLGELLRRAGTQRRPSALSAVVVAGTGGLAAIAVTRLRGTSHIVFRTLPPLAPAIPVIAGASLDADGNPLLMLDPDGVVAAALQHGSSRGEEAKVKQRLLVIDDSLTTRMLEQSILESAGYEVDVATSAEEGLERVRARDYLLILCDVEMPGMDGFGFVETIRSDPKLRDIPAILVTSRNAPEDKRRGQAVGAQDYVVKSEFDQGALLDRIRQLVS